jgi:hypothetical protein
MELYRIVKLLINRIVASYLKMESNQANKEYFLKDGQEPTHHGRNIIFNISLA